MRPRDALQMQADLKTRLWSDRDAWVQVADHMIATMQAQRVTSTGVLDWSSDGAHALKELFTGHGEGENWVDKMSITLSQAQTFVVADQMKPLIRMAAADYPMDLPFSPDMLPSADGFLVYETSWDMRDARNQPLKVKVVTWATRPGGVYVNEFSSMLEPDSITMKIKRESPELYRSNFERLGILQLHHSFSLRYGAPLELAVRQYENPVLREATVGGPATILAIWNLMGQTLTDVTPQKILARDAKLFRRRRVTPVVSVITLRRKAMRSDAPQCQMVTQRDFRWPVRGHWHGYWYGKQGGERVFRKRYVHPYFKGPEDAPIRETKHVHRLAR